MKNAISNILAILWFFGVLIWTVLFLFIGNIMIFFMDIVGMLKTGFATSTIGFAFLFIAGLVFAITGWVPAFRRCYYKLPWLYPLSMMLTMHLGILSIAETILAKGFAVISTPIVSPIKMSWSWIILNHIRRFRFQILMWMMDTVVLISKDRSSRGCSLISERIKSIAL